MSFWSKFAGNALENQFKALVNSKDFAPNLLTGGLYGTAKATLKTSGETFKDFQYRNGGKSAEQEMLRSQEAVGLAAAQQAKQEFDKTSKLASMAYGAGGGMNLQSFTNKSQTKKSILGSF
jgi:hypothetical protein